MAVRALEYGAAGDFLALLVAFCILACAVLAGNGPTNIEHAHVLKLRAELASRWGQVALKRAGF